MLLGFRGCATPFGFVWDQDVAEIIVTGVLRRRTGVYNVAGDGVMTMRDIAAAQGRPLIELPAGAVRTALVLMRRLGVGRYGPEQVDFLRYRPVLDNTRLRRDFPGLPTKTSRAAYQVFRAGQGPG